MLIRISVLLIMMVFIAGCAKDRKTIYDHEWEVKSLKVHADSALYLSDDVVHPRNSSIIGVNLILSFPEKRRFGINTEVNGCGGEVSIKSRNRISFGDMWCTQVCCESEFSDNMLSLLMSAESYELNDFRLILKRPNGGLINFERRGS